MHAVLDENVTVFLSSTVSDEFSLLLRSVKAGSDGVYITKWSNMPVQKLKLKRSTKLQQHKYTSTNLYEEQSLLKTSVTMAIVFN